jgi:hypothetical protein
MEESEMVSPIGTGSLRAACHHLTNSAGALDDGWMQVKRGIVGFV